MGEQREDVSRKKKTKNKKQMMEAPKVNESAAVSNGVDAVEEEPCDDPEFRAWNELRLHPIIMKSIYKLGFKEPAPIQKACIPAAAHQGKDVVGASETGSGKTLAFGLPIFQRLLEKREKVERLRDNKGAEAEKCSPTGVLRALIITPTRELALQVTNHLKEAASIARIRVVPIVGGISSEKQERLLKARPEIVVGTPGRLWQLMSGGEIHLIEKLKMQLSRPLQPKTLSRRFLAGAGVSSLLQQQFEALALPTGLKNKLVVIGQDSVVPLQALRNAGQEVRMDVNDLAAKRKSLVLLKWKRKEEKRPIILVAILYYYSQPTGIKSWIKPLIYCAIAPTILAGQIDPVLFEALYHAIFFCARVPQILKNYTSKSTGELSFLTSFMNFSGSMVRVFTSIQEKTPMSVVLGSVIGILTNGTIPSQILLYSKQPSQKEKKMK